MKKQILRGTVVSDKMQNTIVVEVERKVPHKLYKKIIKITKKFKADKNNMSVAVGDVVSIESTKPMSKTKYFKVTENHSKESDKSKTKNKK